MKPDLARAQARARGGPSRYRGVVWHKSNSKWEARIYENGKQRFLGYFTSEEEAARVYDEAALRIGGRAAKVPHARAHTPWSHNQQLSSFPGVRCGMLLQLRGTGCGCAAALMAGALRAHAGAPTTRQAPS